MWFYCTGALAFGGRLGELGFLARCTWGSPFFNAFVGQRRAAKAPLGLPCPGSDGTAERCPGRQTRGSGGRLSALVSLLGFGGFLSTLGGVRSSARHLWRFM